MPELCLLGATAPVLGKAKAGVCAMNSSLRLFPVDYLASVAEFLIAAFEKSKEITLFFLISGELCFSLYVLFCAKTYFYNSSLIFLAFQVDSEGDQIKNYNTVFI